MTNPLAPLFLASMELYQNPDGSVTAHVRMRGEESSQEVEVPPHMAAMLPQAIAMIKSQSNGAATIDAD